MRVLYSRAAEMASGALVSFPRMLDATHVYRPRFDHVTRPILKSGACFTSVPLRRNSNCAGGFASALHLRFKEPYIGTAFETASLVRVGFLGLSTRQSRKETHEYCVSWLVLLKNQAIELRLLHERTDSTGYYVAVRRVAMWLSRCWRVCRHANGRMRM